MNLELLYGQYLNTSLLSSLAQLHHQADKDRLHYFKVSQQNHNDSQPYHSDSHQYHSDSHKYHSDSQQYHSDESNDEKISESSEQSNNRLYTDSIGTDDFNYSQNYH